MDTQALQKMERALMARIRAIEQKKRSIGKERHRIGIGMDLVTKMAAATFDIGGAVCNLIPFVGGLLASLVAIVGNVVFALVYLFMKAKPSAGKSVGRSAVKRSLVVRIMCFFFELIPFVNILPGFSIAIWYTSAVVRKEDKEYNEHIKKTRKEIQIEERSLQRDMRQFTQFAEKYRYNAQYEEEAERIRINESDDEDRLAA